MTMHAWWRPDRAPGSRGKIAAGATDVMIVHPSVFVDTTSPSSARGNGAEGLDGAGGPGGGAPSSVRRPRPTGT